MIKLQEVAQILGRDSARSPEIPSFRSQEISIKNIVRVWSGAQEFKGGKKGLACEISLMAHLSHILLMQCSGKSTTEQNESSPPTPPKTY